MVTTYVYIVTYMYHLVDIGAYTLRYFTYRMLCLHTFTYIIKKNALNTLYSNSLRTTIVVTKYVYIVACMYPLHDIGAYTLT